MINYDRIYVFVLVIDLLSDLVARLLKHVSYTSKTYAGVSIFNDQRKTQFIPEQEIEPDIRCPRQRARIATRQLFKF